MNSTIKNLVGLIRSIQPFYIEHTADAVGAAFFAIKKKKFKALFGVFAEDEYFELHMCYIRIKID